MAKSNRGFASLPETRRKEIAGRGGSAAQLKGTAHRWTAKEAKVAGRKGGKKKHENLKNRQQALNRLQAPKFEGCAQPGCLVDRDALELHHPT